MMMQRTANENQFGLYNVVAPLSFLRSISLASLFDRYKLKSQPRSQGLFPSLRAGQPRSQGLFPSLGAGREKTLASAGHVSTLHPEILGVIN